MRVHQHFVSFAAIAFWICSVASAAPPKLARVEPREAGFDSTLTARIDAAVADALQAKKLPGCVVCIGRGDKIALLKAYGNNRVEPAVEPMTTDTVFDLASLTKPLATGTSVMILRERGLLRLDDPVAKHLPEFAAQGKDAITVEHLLIHQGGLIADNSLNDYRDGPETAWRKICELKPVAEPGTKFIYSDVGFIVLGELVRRISGRDLADFSRDNIFAPLGLTETGYLPAEPLRARAAPTQQRDGHWMQGEVHDPRAFLLGGVAGHAGLFSTAEDLAVLAALLSNRGEFGGVRLLNEESWTTLTAPRKVSSGVRTLGWDRKTGYSINRGTTMSEQAFGHGGFTGTGLWIDPATKLFVIFLSNRVHPDGKANVNPLIGQIGTIAADSLR